MKGPMRSLLIVAAVSAAVIGAAPAATHAQSQPFVLDRPDGTIFVAAPGGGARHVATGFVCPASLNGAERRALYIFDASDHGRDVGCGYGKPGTEAWYTLYMAKLDDAESKNAFEKEVRTEQKAAPLKSEAKAPLNPGLPPLPERAAFWTSTNDLVDGLWFASIGPWHVNLHATFSEGHEAEVAAVARTVWSQVFEEVKGPEV
jgi:hypothetical protein